MMRRFEFEKLDAVGVAVDMLATVDGIAEELPTGRGYMRDQLRRAANSVVLNLAEGAGEFSPSEKARFYRISRRSATEAAAQLLVIERLRLAGDTETARELLHRVISMLVRMCKAAQTRAREERG